MVVIDLPFPISANRMWRRSGSRIHISKEYAAWKSEADAMFMQQKRAAGKPIKGAFTYHIALDGTRWPKASDGDNRGKCLLDFLQRVGLIENDKYAASGTWSWAPVKGCTVAVRPVEHARIKAA